MTTTTRHRPGVLEALVGLAVFAVVAYGVPPLLRTTGLKTDDPAGYGLALGALSGVAGIVALVVAMSLRVRTVAPFGIRRTARRWVFIAIVGGIVVWVLSRLVTLGWTLLFGAPENVQATYGDAAQSGLVGLVLSTLFLAVLTPIGEEALFRGVVATVMLRWGWVVGVVGSAVVFALFHGLNLAMVPALLTGLVNAELRRRSDSIWPGVVVHVVNNVLANVIAAFVL